MGAAEGGTISGRRPMELEEFRSGLDAWLDEQAAALAPSGAVGSLDDEMAQLAKVKWATFDAGWMRWGWPERVGGLGGSPILRAYLGEALTARDLVNAGGYSMTEVLAPTVIDYARPELKRCGARVSPSPGRGATWPRCRAGLCASTMAGGSPARRCGPATRSTRPAACC